MPLTPADYEAQALAPHYSPRLTPTPIPSAGVFDEPTRCLTINAEWASHVIGTLEALSQRDTWVGTDEEIEAAIDQVEELIAALSKGECVNPCDCPPTLADIQRTVRENAQRVARNFDAWDGTPGSINPYAQGIVNFDQGGFFSDKSANNCAAACEYVRIVVWQYYQLLIAAAVIGAAITVVVAPIGALFWILGAAITLVAGIGYDRVQAVIDDPDAMNTMGCRLATALEGQTASGANFNTAVFNLQADNELEETIKAILKASAPVTGGFYLYLDIWAEAEKMIQGGTIPPCCCDDPCEWDIDLTVGIPFNVEVLKGTWVQGSGLQSVSIGGGQQQAAIYVHLSEPCFPDAVCFRGENTSVVSHDFWYRMGHKQEDGSIVWEGNDPQPWQGSAGGTFEHCPAPQGTTPFDIILFYVQDDTASYLTGIAAVNNP